MNREEAYQLLAANVPSKNLQKHCLAVGIVMEALAVRFNEDKDKWYITGILHDIDYEQTKEDPLQHGIVAREILMPYKLPEDIINAISSHSGNTPIITFLDKCLWAADPVTGFIIAAALMNPEKKISAIQLPSLKKKFKSKGFAAGANREQIASCSELGLELDSYLELCLLAMGTQEEKLL